MTITEQTLSLTYAEILIAAKESIRVHQIHRGCFPFDDHERGLLRGVCQFWHGLAVATGAPQKQRDEDYKQLRLLAGLSVDDLEQPADES
ncbi:hypothetical protein [Pseudescherichia vulneris]|uniref:hypothetical protein n=1 Tax=Pseudescherichia vulneris TaxID=566 RepID=UPI001EDEA3CC|nr:hypothetical protein [Pseudescherichia vulneris]